MSTNQAQALVPANVSANQKKKGKKNKGKTAQGPSMALAAVPRSNKLFLLKQAMGNHLNLSNGQSPSKVLSLMSDQQRSFFKTQMGLFVHSLYGTAEPILNLPLIPQTVGVVGGIYVPVYNIEYTNVHDNSAWTTLFDEYQFHDGHVTHEPQYMQTAGSATGSAQYVGVGVIDYEDTAALSNVAVANGYDTAKWYPVAPINYHPVTWEFHFQGIPDRSWVSTGTNSTPGCWKGISDQSPFAMGNVTTGRMHGRVRVQFRQIR